jgi:hypothetical protein
LRRDRTISGLDSARSMDIRLGFALIDRSNSLIESSILPSNRGIRDERQHPRADFRPQMTLSSRIHVNGVGLPGSGLQGHWFYRIDVNSRVVASNH